MVIACVSMEGIVWRRLAPYDPNMGGLALRGAGRDINVRPQTRLRQTVRDVIHARLLLRLAHRDSCCNLCKSPYSAGAGSGSRRSEPESCCRGRPIRTGWNSTAAANVQNNAKAMSLPMLAMPG